MFTALGESNYPACSTPASLPVPAPFCRMQTPSGARRKTIAGNDRNLQLPSFQDGSTNTRLQIHDVYNLAGWKSQFLTQGWFSVCAFASAAPGMVGGILNLLTVAVKLYF